MCSRYVFIATCTLYGFYVFVIKNSHLLGDVYINTTRVLWSVFSFLMSTNDGYYLLLITGIKATTCFALQTLLLPAVL